MATEQRAVHVYVVILVLFLLKTDDSLNNTFYHFVACNDADVCNDRFSETGFLSWKEKCYVTHAQQLH